jgi:hypothetical protein
VVGREVLWKEIPPFLYYCGLKEAGRQNTSPLPNGPPSTALVEALTQEVHLPNWEVSVADTIILC